MKNIFIALVLSLNLFAGTGGPVGNPQAVNLLTTGQPAGLVPVSDGLGTVTLSAAGTGTVSTPAAVGASPNANALTITGANISLQPASASFPGVITTGTQTLAGAKTFSSLVDLTTGEIKKGGVKYIHSPGTNNFFAGVLAGDSISSGSNNTFSGQQSGTNTTSGSNSSYYGRSAGASNTIGGENSFFGALSGSNNISGSRDSCFGVSSGGGLVSGNDNSFFGQASGGGTQTGNGNSFFGSNSGTGNRVSNNSAFGFNAGLNLNNGGSNSFFGNGAGNTTFNGSRNILIGDGVIGSSANFNDELAIGSWIRGNTNLLDLKVFGLTVLTLNDSGEVFTPSAKFNLNALGNITRINNVNTSFPSVQGAASSFLQNDGTGTLSWAAVAGAGVTTMTAVGASPNANGATISGANLTLQPASQTLPGVMNAIGQTFGGVKNFAGTSTQVKRFGLVETGTVFSPNFQMDIRSDFTVAPAQYIIACNADVAGSLNNTYFYISAIGLSGDALFRDYYFWINVSGTGTDPAPRAGTGVEVPINTNDTADDVAIAVSAALSSTGTLNPVSTILNVISITANRNGAPQLNASTETSTFGVTNLNTGVGQVYSQYSGIGAHANYDGSVFGYQPSGDGGTVIFNRTKNIVLSTYPGGGQVVTDAAITATGLMNVQTRDPGATVEYDLTNSAGTASGAINLIPSGVMGISASGGVTIGGVGFPVNINDALNVNTADVNITGIGNGIRIAQGADARMDSCTLVAGTCTITNANVQAAGSGAGTDSIYCTGQDDNGGTAGAVRVSARTVGVDYTVTSTNVLDTSIVSCLLVGGL